MEYPLHFKYRDVVVGNGFTAGVEVLGRVLMSVEAEDEGVWFYGAVPGAISAFGESPTIAHAEFRDTYRAILQDLAQESVDFGDFKARVEGFALASAKTTLEAWDKALSVVRRDGTEIEGLLKREAPEPTVDVSLFEVDRLPIVRFVPCDSEQVEKALAA